MMAFKIGDRAKYIGASGYFLSCGDEVTVTQIFPPGTYGYEGNQENWYVVLFGECTRAISEKNLDHIPSHAQVTREPWDVLREAASILSGRDSYLTAIALEHIAKSMENTNKVEKHKEALEAANKAVDKVLEDLYESDTFDTPVDNCHLRERIARLQRAMKAKKDLEASKPVG